MPSGKNAEKKPAIYFLAPAEPGISPGQRFRFEHYLGLLREKGQRIRISSFYTLSGWKSLYKPGNKFRKVRAVLAGLFRRLGDLFRIPFYDYVYLYREAAPIGPPFFEWVITRLLRKKVIYDFDDAIWIPISSEYNKAASGLRNFAKVGKICSWSYKVSVGNQFLGNYAAEYNQQVVLLPTVVDTENGHNRIQDQETSYPAIGWTGTFSTLPYLNILLPVLQRLQEKIPFTFYVIADKDPQLPLKYYQFIQWSREKETADLLHFHIGLMPLHDDEISRGKCGFKAIQYMALGIPAVVSPVGVNSIIVQHAVNGFVCDQESAWEEALTTLLTDSSLRKKMGAAARQQIEDHYSVKATTQDFLALFS
jgi:glycosyltransferase involved in cell wall biosynthesis